MDRPDAIYVIYNATDGEVVTGRTGIAYLKIFDANNEIKRLNYLYPDKNFELLIYDKF